MESCFYEPTRYGFFLEDPLDAVPLKAKERIEEALRVRLGIGMSAPSCGALDVQNKEKVDDS